MKNITFQNRVRYKFDRIMSRGQIALIGLLFLLTVIAIGIFTLLLLVMGGFPEEWKVPHLVWQLFLRTIDPGTMAGDEGGWPFLFMMLAVTLGGIFIFSTLIGLLTTGIEDKLAQFRKGRSFVAEENHFLILGWSSMIFTIIRQLALANSGRRDACITILAKRDKIAMEDEIAKNVNNLGTTRLVCRSGNPIILNDLEIVNPYAARSIIILGSEENNPDVRVIKTILALTGSPNRQRAPYQITAVMHHRNNLEAARVVGKDEAKLLLSGNLLARIAAQVCSKSGLSLVYEELLDFRGNDVYFVKEPALVGQTFADTLLAYENATLIGLRSEKRGIWLKPPGDTVITAEYECILLAAKKQNIRLADEKQIPRTGLPAPSLAPASSEVGKFLLLGWNKSAATFIDELDFYAGAGSTLTIVARRDDLADYLESRGEQNTGRSLTLNAKFGDTSDRRELDALQVHTYDHVVVLSYSDRLESQDADAQTLVTLLHLRHIADTHPDRHFTVVTEMLDPLNRELAEVTRPNDFIVSYQLISQLLAQISQNRERFDLYQELFTSTGSEIYFRAAAEYVNPGKGVPFSAIVIAASQREEIAIGYRVWSEKLNHAQHHGIRLNPDKFESLTLREEDQIIVLAEHYQPVHK